MPHPYIIFTESHYDAAVCKLIKKITPKLQEAGYKCFFNEAPEGTTIVDFIKNQQSSADQIRESGILSIKWQADKGVFPRELFYGNKEHTQLVAAYFAKLEAVECAHIIDGFNIAYQAIDVKEVVDPSTHDYMGSDEGMKLRNNKMTSAYLASLVPVFGIVGYKHAIGMQHEILSRLSLEEALKKFCFVHVFSEPPLDDYEEQLRAGEMLHPLALNIFNANEIKEEEIIELILEKSGIKIINTKVDNDSNSSNTSSFFNLSNKSNFTANNSEDNPYGYFYQK